MSEGLPGGRGPRIEMNCDPERTSIASAKKWLREHAKKGAACPCCTQRVQFYVRRVYSAPARVLIWIDRYYRRHADWLHVPGYLTEKGVEVGVGNRGGDWSKMKHFGLIEPMPRAIRSDGSKRTGMWRITELGKQFVRNEARVPAFKLMFDSQVFFTSEETICIHDALGDDFNYGELMKGEDND